MEKFYRKYPWFKGIESLDDDIKYMKIDDVLDFVNDYLNELRFDDGLEETSEISLKLREIKNKIADFDRDIILKDTVNSAKENLFKIIRKEKINKSFPDYTEIKRLTDKEYNDLIHKMPDEENRKKLENLLVKRILEKSDYKEFLTEDIAIRLSNLLYKQIDNYNEMKPIGVFNTLYDYSL
tara:strand:+ start:1432 stop:1974 length:543 start_codon:yes stop_codon:yes gene_type:complete